MYVVHDFSEDHYVTVHRNGEFSLRFNIKTILEIGHSVDQDVIWARKHLFKALAIIDDTNAYLPPERTIMEQL